MKEDSSDVFRCDLGHLLQGQTRIAKLKSAYNLLIIEKCCSTSKPCYSHNSQLLIICAEEDMFLVAYILLDCKITQKVIMKEMT